jgi:hypothetical protein
MKLLLLNIFLFGLIGFAPFSSHAELLFSNDFENGSTSNFILNYSTISNSGKSFSGNSHLQITTQNASFNVFSTAQTFVLNKGKKYLVSCYADTRGLEAQFNFSCAGIKCEVQVNPNQIGYQLVYAVLNADQNLFGNFDLEINCPGNKKIFLDDISIVECSSEVPIRPFATQPMANGHGLSYDVLEKIELDGVSIESKNRTTVDGYRIWNDINTELIPGISYELDVKTSFSEFPCHLLAWMDVNGNGSFDSNEALNVTKTSAEKAKIQLILPVDFNANSCFIRLRYLQENENQLVTPISGDHWGETVDLLLGVKNQTQVTDCTCSDPYYIDINGRRVASLHLAPSGTYIYVCGECSSKIVFIRE